jgi:hypothetical protein
MMPSHFYQAASNPLKVSIYSVLGAFAGVLIMNFYVR